LFSSAFRFAFLIVVVPPAIAVVCIAIAVAAMLWICIATLVVAMLFHTIVELLLSHHAIPPPFPRRRNALVAMHCPRRCRVVSHRSRFPLLFRSYSVFFCLLCYTLPQSHCSPRRRFAIVVGHLAFFSFWIAFFTCLHLTVLFCYHFLLLAVLSSSS